MNRIVGRLIPEQGIRERSGREQATLGRLAGLSQAGKDLIKQAKGMISNMQSSGDANREKVKALEATLQGLKTRFDQERSTLESLKESFGKDFVATREIIRKTKQATKRAQQLRTAAVNRQRTIERYGQRDPAAVQIIAIAGELELLNNQLIAYENIDRKLEQQIIDLITPGLETFNDLRKDIRNAQTSLNTEPVLQQLPQIQTTISTVERRYQSLAAAPKNLQLLINKHATIQATVERLEGIIMQLLQKLQIKNRESQQLHNALVARGAIPRQAA